MDPAEAVEAEESHGIMEGYFKISSDDVHRFEGTVNEYCGDGLMALSGALIAHENHAQRARYAALHLPPLCESVSFENELNLSVRDEPQLGSGRGRQIGDNLTLEPSER